MAVVGTFLLAACASASTTVPSPTPTSTATPDISAPGGLRLILATTVLRPGSQRVAFLLTGPKALITVPEVSVTTFFDGDPSAANDPVETNMASFNLWPYATRGSYTTELTFDRPGTWRLSVEMTDKTGAVSTANHSLEVNDGYGVVDVGSQAPHSRSKTVKDVSGLTELSSDHPPDPDLYAITIADALATTQPTMVVFSTPAFCISPTCGPQVETMQGVKNKFKGDANFIHVEFYDNPDEVQGDLDRAVISLMVDEWGITNIPHWTNESWTFVIDRDGTVTARFEGFAAASELEATLQEVL